MLGAVERRLMLAEVPSVEMQRLRTEGWVNVPLEQLYQELGSYGENWNLVSHAFTIQDGRGFLSFVLERPLG
jgi:hypothetical protein